MLITTGKVRTYEDADSGETLQSVPWAITEGEGEDAVELLTGIQSFPLSATKEDVSDFLSRRLEVYKADVASHEAASVRQADLEHAAEVAEEISGITITDK